MVYFNKEKNSILLTCNCECGNSLKFIVSDSVLYVDALASTFSTKQDKIKYRVKEKCSFIKNKIQKKPIYQNGLILDEEEFKNFLEDLKIIVDAMNENEEDALICQEKDKSAIHITKMKITEEHILYDINLRLCMNTKDLLLHQHRAYETYFSKDQMRTFIQNMEKKFK